MEPFFISELRDKEDVKNAVKTGDDMLPNEHWNHIKNVILKSATTNIGIEKKRPAKNHG